MIRTLTAFAMMAATLAAQVGPNDLVVAPGTPIPTIDAALRQIRLMRQKAELKLPLTVWIRGGVYPVERPVTLSPEDSGPITFAAYPGEQPVFDAGTHITGWTPQKVNGVDVWVADVSSHLARRGPFRSLFVNGERRPRSRLPKTGAYRIANVPGREVRAGLFAGSNVFQATPGEVRNWKNLEDVVIRVLHYWTDERMPIQSLDEKTGLVTSSRWSIFSLAEGFTGRWAEFWVENVFEALSEPGEWYLDRKDGKLYYVPKPGEATAATEVVAAGSYQFLRLMGIPEQGKLVTGITFKGLTFRFSDWVQPEQDGKYFDPYVAEDTRRKQDATHRFLRDHGEHKKMAATPQSAIHAPGVISLVGTHNSAIIDCRLEHIGFWGINLADGCRNNRIEGNTIIDMGGGGVKIDGADYPSQPELFSGNNRVTDNVIRTGGRVFMTAAGIIVTNGFGNLIAHNEISDLYQIGVSAGWDWTRRQTVTRDNRIEKNHIFRLGQKQSSDMGGVYLLGVQPGTAIRNNVIHDVEHAHYGGWGIYTDAATSNVVIENNIVYDVSTHAILTNNTSVIPNRENIVRNNIFAFGGQGVARVAETWRAKRRNPDGKAATYLHNIFVSGGEQLYVVDFRDAPAAAKNDIFISDLNLFWDLTKKTPVICRALGKNAEPMSWDEWRKRGSDRHSSYADPAFRDLSKRDFTLAPESPAFQTGFEPIDVSDVGPRPPEKRK
jgi:hypothetical protein